MRVLMVTGDKSFGPGYPRFELQRNAVERLEVVYMGRGSRRPALPEGPFDVVTAQDPFWRGLFAWGASRRLRAKLNIQVHTDLSAYSFLRRSLARMVLRRADSVRVVSEKIKQQVERMGVTAPIRVLPVFVDLSRFSSVIRRAHSKPTILWIGRFEAEKDPLRAVSILEEVIHKGVDAQLVMIGAGTLEHSLRERAKALPVEFPGWRDPAAYLATADVVLSTSQHESYGASIIEALAAGVPVVAPDVGVAKEAGAVVAPHGQLAQAVQDVFESGKQGTLRLVLPTPAQWVTEWKASLI